ncbi:virB8 family protein (plasmid) [Xylella fastidiosa]|uniref:virB8 family protein n=1 Tax=Xylella fastidiosa TaxID=2371 RepID=UPI0003D2EDF4|nr:virB8 family protein [Xylella fastidiosa]ALR05468.1 virB8 family protein [Xylella fastidiosa]OJZ69105.1 conjugal transfer protein [Xylella fastidiosa 6c]
MKSNVDKKDFDNYLKEARTWETDKVHDLLKSRKTAWWVAGASAAIAFVAVLAVAALTPLKTTEPYIIRVDNNTGAVDVVKAMKEGKTNYDEAINKYFVQWYVRYRESYSRELADDYYSYVGIFSNNVEQQKYYAAFNAKNPQSPLNIYGIYAKVKIDIQSTSFINSNVALVRYTKKVERGLDQPQITHWIATITFKYLNTPMNEKDRGINPLGFQVSEYRNDPDAAVNNINTPDNNGQTAPQIVTPAEAVPGVAAFPSATTPAPVPVVPSVKQ